VLGAGGAADTPAVVPTRTAVATPMLQAIFLTPLLDAGRTGCPTPEDGSCPGRDADRIPHRGER
jgi:hypothetical protein